MRLSAEIDANRRLLDEALQNCFDIARRDFVTTGGRAVRVMYTDGLANKGMVNDDIVRPLMEVVFSVNPENRRIENAADTLAQVLCMSDLRLVYTRDEAITLLLSGDTLIFIDGSEGAIAAQTRSWQNRGVQEPATQTTVRGPREGFTETLLFNTALLRRKLKTPRLKTEILTVGRISRTAVCVAYIEGLADAALIESVKARIAGISVDYVLESGHIEQLIDENKRSLFATAGNNEKPDVVAAKLIKGRVAVFTDGTPFVLTLPSIFTESFQAAEDYYSRPYFANCLRVLRVLAYIVALTLPALYVALCLYHREMIPQKLLLTILAAREGVPFSIATETALMLILYELLREAILRLPKPVGGAVGIVGVLIIGDAAVSAGIIAPPVVVIAALTFIASAVTNPLADSTAILRFVLLALASFLGLFGILTGLFAIAVQLCSLESFGTPYMFPVSPATRKGLRDSIIRGDIDKILNGRSNV